MHLVEFPLSFVSDPQKPHERLAIRGLAEQLKAESPGILAWAVRGNILYQRHGLNPPDKVIKATMEYRKTEDIYQMFVDERCITGPGLVTQSKVLYDDFTEWFERNIGKRVPSHHRFGRRMQEKFEKVKVNGVYMYYGIGLSADAPDLF
jgi:putative DNA primase/helicase